MRCSWPFTVLVTSSLWANYAFAFEATCGGYGPYAESPSCFNGAAQDRPSASRFDISKATFSRMLDLLGTSRNQRIPPDSALISTLPELGKTAENLPDTHMLFFYYDNDNSKAANDGDHRTPGNSDCHLYTSIKIQESPARPIQELTPAIDASPCDYSSMEFAVLYKAATEPKVGLFVTPAERYLLAEHPDPRIAPTYVEGYTDHWLLFTKQFGLPDELVPEREKWSDVLIPTWEYVTEESMSAYGVAERLDLGERAGDLLIELNLDTFKYTDRVDKNVTIHVPANIVGWEEIGEEGEAPEVLAERYYGSDEYEALVSAMQQLDSEKGNFLPIFKAPGDFKPAPATMQMR